MKLIGALFTRIHTPNVSYLYFNNKAVPQQLIPFLMFPIIKRIGQKIEKICETKYLNQMQRCCFEPFHTAKGMGYNDKIAICIF